MTALTFQTRLSSSSIDDYDRIHAAIPSELARDIEAAGCDEWAIFRMGTVLTHVTRVSDAARFFGALDVSAAHARWQKRIAPLLDPSPLEILADVPDHLGTLVWWLGSETS